MRTETSMLLYSICLFPITPCGAWQVNLFLCIYSAQLKTLPGFLSLRLVFCYLFYGDRWPRVADPIFVHLALLSYVAIYCYLTSNPIVEVDDKRSNIQYLHTTEIWDS
jgi:hypothetical protein